MLNAQWLLGAIWVLTWKKKKKCILKYLHFKNGFCKLEDFFLDNFFSVQHWSSIDEVPLLSKVLTESSNWNLKGNFRLQQDLENFICLNSVAVLSEKLLSPGSCSLTWKFNWHLHFYLQWSSHQFLSNSGSF